MHSLIFFGSDRYSAVALSALLASGLYPLTSLTVVTDHHEGGSPVEQLALSHGLKPTYYPTTPEEKAVFVTHLKSYFQNLKSPIGLCASFDHLIPQDIIKFFGGNLYNLHPSLLPQYRNVSPVQYAIALGDTVTGITLFRISPGIDDGEIIAQAEEPILPEDTTATLTPRLFTKGAQLFIDFLQGSVPCNPADDYKVRNLVAAPLIFTKRLTRDSGYIEWSVLHQLLQNKTVALGESKNELLNLRLEREKTKSSHLASNIYLLDLMRALNPWPTVWSLVPSKKGELRITLVHTDPLSSPQTPRILLAGKPSPISFTDFTKYYL